MELNLATHLPRNQDEIAWMYNGIDCLITHEVLEELKPQAFHPDIVRTYRFALAKQAPIMEMEMRGIAVNPIRLKRVQRAIAEDEKHAKDLFNQLCEGVFNTSINPNSHVQVKQLFYERLRLPTVKKRNSKGEYAPSSNEDALNHLKNYWEGRPFANFILLLRDLRKQLSFLESVERMRGRVYSSFSIAGTVTGRLASKYSDFGTGTNLQNIDRRLRSIFTADSGMALVNIDLEQADSRNVGAIIHNLFRATYGDEFAGRYLNACESGDLHTSVAKLVWPDKGWTDDIKMDRAIADEIYYRQDSFRQTSKKLGHASNYRGKAATIAKATSTPVGVVRSFQERYYNAFPGIQLWWEYIDEQFSRYPGTLTTLYGRQRTFFGRHNDAQTLRDATAYEPQSMTGHQIDTALHAVWRAFPEVQLLLQVHDNILFQIPESSIPIIPSICSLMQEAHTIELAGGRDFFVPVEAKVGTNWGDYDKNENPGGLKKIS